MNEIRGIKEIIGSCDCDVCKYEKYDKGDCAERRLDKTKQEIIELIKSLIPKGEIQFLSKSNLKYQMGWCGGRNQLREEINKQINKILKGD